MSDHRSPFNWKGAPSIFTADKDFVPYKTGKTRNQTMTDAVERITRETGRSPGTLTGISKRTRVEQNRARHRFMKTGVV